MNKTKRLLLLFSLFTLSAVIMVGFQNFSKIEHDVSGCKLAKKTYKLNANIVETKWRTLALSCPQNNRIQDLYHSYFHTVVTQWNSTTNNEKQNKPCSTNLNIIPAPEQILSNFKGC